MALKDNLIAYWKLNEASGAARDSVSTYPLVNNNSVAYVTGLIGNGVDYGTTNSNKYLSISSNLEITGGAISISTWIKMRTEIASGEQALVNQESSTNRNAYDITYQYNGGSRRIAFRRLAKGVAQDGPTGTIALGTTNWHHLVLTYDGATLTGYIDGVSIGTMAISGAGTGGTTYDRFSLGCLYADNTPQYFASCIQDETGVWSRALTSAEVTQLYNAGSGVSYPFSNTEIAFDAARESNTGSASTLTYAHVCSGNNRILYVGVMASSARTITSVTYGGTAMMQINRSAGSQPMALYQLVNPPSGSNNIVITINSSSFIYAASASYTGARQSAQPDANNTGSTSGTSLTTSVTTVANNSWAVLFARGDSDGDTNAGTNSFERIAGTGFIQMYDTNGPKTPVGSLSMTVTAASQNITTAMASFAPSAVSINPQLVVSD